MKKTNLIVSLGLVLTMLVAPMAAYATESADIVLEAEVQKAIQQLDIQLEEVAPGLEVNVVQARAGTLLAVRSYEDLLTALELTGVIDGALLLNDITLEDIVEIDRDFAISGVVDGMRMYAPVGQRHLKLTGDDFTLDLSNVIIDCSYRGNARTVTGGIEVYATGSQYINVTGGTYEKLSTQVLGGGVAGGAFNVFQGKLQIDNALIQNNSSLMGTAIYTTDDAEEVVLTNSVLTKNYVNSGGHETTESGAIEGRADIVLKNVEISESLGNAIIMRGYQLTVEDSIIQGNAGLGGYAISAPYGSNEVVVRNSQLINNGTGGMFGGGGGGVYIGAESIITLEDTVISENTSSENGGAVYNLGTATLLNCELSSNRAADNGGAIYSVGDLTVKDCIITNNTAEKNGGGIYIESGRVELSDITFSGNTPQNVYW